MSVIHRYNENNHLSLSIFRSLNLSQDFTLLSRCSKESSTLICSFQEDSCQPQLIFKFIFFTALNYWSSSKRVEWHHNNVISLFSLIGNLHPKSSYSCCFPCFSLETYHSRRIFYNGFIVSQSRDIIIDLSMNHWTPKWFAAYKLR